MRACMSPESVGGRVGVGGLEAGRASVCEGGGGEVYIIYNKVIYNIIIIINNNIYNIIIIVIIKYNKKV